jgi:hypothetical protein
MDLSAHKKLAALISTSNASLKQMRTICAKNEGTNSGIPNQIKDLLESLTSVKQQLLTDLDKINKPHINPYGK